MNSHGRFRVESRQVYFARVSSGILQRVWSAFLFVTVLRVSIVQSGEFCFSCCKVVISTTPQTPDGPSFLTHRKLLCRVNVPSPPLVHTWQVRVSGSRIAFHAARRFSGVGFAHAFSLAANSAVFNALIFGDD